MRPEPDTLSSQLALSDLQRINDVCNRFEAAWRAGIRPCLEEFLAAAPPCPTALHQLLLLDLDYRRQHGDHPCAGDYLARFPTLDPDWLAAALAGNGTVTLRAPPPGFPADAFLDRLERLGLLGEEDLQSLRGLVRTSPGTTTETLAQRLVAEGKLAEFQARALSGPVETPLVLGPYVLDGWIAAGGMGQVFRATHVRMKRVVAVKVVGGGTATRPEALRRFQHEVEVAARLRHPNIVTAYDAGEQDGVAYLVTEFILGEDLGRLVRRAGPTSVATAVARVRQAALGLAHAHGQGVIHRDVKPSNLLLDRDEVVRVLDFGLARTVGTEAERRHDETNSPTALTGTGTFLGTPDYMAPEQADEAARADERSDIYSLGCTLHYLLTGRPPYLAATLEDLLRAHRRSSVPSLRAARADVPVGLDRLFAQLAAKKPADRPADMAAVVAALDAVAGSRTSRLSRRTVLAVAGVALAGVATFALWPTDQAPIPARLPFDGRAEQQRWADALNLPVVTTDNPLRLRLVLVPPGEHGTRPYYLGATEVTVGQFRRFVTASRPQYVTVAERDGGWGWHAEQGWRRDMGFSWRNAGELVLTDEHPAVNLSRVDAEAFCRWLTVQSNCVYRLPTEAEWEFACRAGSAGAWCFGDDSDRLPLYAWTADDGGDVPRPVARKRPNDFGLFDMHGNLFEWCRSDDERSPVELPARGGSFRSAPDQTHCSARQLFDRFDVIPGFRVVQVLPPRP